MFHPTQIERHPSLGPAEGLHVNPHGPRPAFIHGHYDLPTLRRAGPDRFMLTFLREPRARTLSLCYFWRSVPGRMLEFPPPSVVPEVNVAASNEWGRSSAFKPVWREPVTPEIEAERARLTRLDLAIYDAARNRLANQHNDLVGGSAGLGTELGP